MPSTLLELASRSAVGTIAAKALRRNGRIPATLYGHGENPLSISIGLRQITEVIRAGAEHHLIEITLDGGRRETALVRGIQRDPITRVIEHVDLLRVSSGESIRASIPLILTGVAPGVKNDGGILDLLAHHLEISGPAASLPESLEVDISALGLREHLTAAQIPLPSGFSLVTPGESLVVTIEPPRVSTAAEEAPTSTAPSAAPTTTPPA